VIEGESDRDSAVLSQAGAAAPASASGASKMHRGEPLFLCE
jgi:hypothetical protein